MLNIKELTDLLTDKSAPAEDTRTTLIVIALVEQRIVLERIAELLDVGHMDSADTQGQLGRIARAFEDHNRSFDAAVKTIVDEPPQDELPGDEPEIGVVHFADQHQKNGTACSWREEGDSAIDDASKVTCSACKVLMKAGVENNFVKRQSRARMRKRAYGRKDAFQCIGTLLSIVDGATSPTNRSD